MVRQRKRDADRYRESGRKTEVTNEKRQRQRDKAPWPRPWAGAEGSRLPCWV